MILTATRDRFHDATLTGPLGDPGSPTQAKARVSYSASYYDPADRLTDAVDVGTNGGAAYTRPAGAPARSDTVLVTSYGYNEAGEVEAVTDPKGLVTKTFYDLLGRTTKTIENYVNGVVESDDMSEADDKTVEYEYGPAGLTKLRVVLPGGAEETTTYEYGVSPLIAGDTLTSNDLLYQTHRPDAITGVPGSESPNEAHGYNALGELTVFGNTNSEHDYAYDTVGRLVSDQVSAYTVGVDASVLRIETAYDGQGNAYLVTSYNAVAGGAVVNQVKRDYNGLGQLTTEWQAHGGAVVTSGQNRSPRVQYSYSEMAGGANHSRLTSVTYPTTTRVVTYDYGPAGGLDDRISRLDALQGTSIAFEQYQYLGLGTVVERELPQPGVDLTYFQPGATGEAGDQYPGLDRFGRVVDQRWQKTSNGADVDRYQYAYDRDSNRTSRTNVVNTNFNEAYTYDGLNQLTGFNTTGTAKSWDYDAAGNWDGVTTNGSTQSRTHNKQNEIASATGQATPTYDIVGNQTTDFGGRTYTYDPWGRVIQAGSRVYEYDGLGRRIQRTVSGTALHFFYDDQWRAVEDRVNGVVVDQYVWSPVYVDAMVLRDRDTDGDGVVDERLYVAQDANYNVTAVVGLVNTSWVVLERYAYDPYGERAVYGPNWGVRNASSYSWVYNFQGLRLDTVTDKYYARNRDYDPAEGRWTRMDPTGYWDGPNQYEYVHNDPTTGLDPSGLTLYKFNWRVRSDCPCPCTGPNNDCVIDVIFLKRGDVVQIDHKRDGRPASDVTTITEDSISGSKVSNRFWDINEHQPTLVILRSKSDELDVSRCTLTQNVVNRYIHRYGSDLGFDSGFAPDYNLEKNEEKTRTNLAYGGWWLFDTPGYSEKKEIGGLEAKQFPKQYWIQFHVYLEEEKSLQTYWGYSVEFNWDGTPAGKNPAGPHKTFGPVATKQANPFRKTGE